MRLLLLTMLPFLIFADTGADLLDKRPEGVNQDGPFGKYQTPSAETPIVGPFLTGPLLTPSAYTIPKGHFNIEPYVFVSNDLGHFGSKGHLHADGELIESVNTVIICQLGLTENLDISILPQFSYNYSTGKHERSALGMGDLIVGPSYQMIRETDFSWRVGLMQVFPCGRFENLNPLFAGRDGLGHGVWATKLLTCISNLFHVQKQNYLATRACLSVIFFTPLEVHGKNYYGGDGETTGTLSRGASVILDLGMEFTLSTHWTLALDVENLYVTPSEFEGTSGATTVGSEGSTYLLSLAPAVEYNYNENFGIIAGLWFSAIGYDVEGFTTAVIAVNFYI